MVEPDELSVVEALLVTVGGVVVFDLLQHGIPKTLARTGGHIALMTLFLVLYIPWAMNGSLGKLVRRATGG